jgi:hypothetical protein
VLKKEIIEIMASVHTNQKLCGDEILAAYETNTIFHILLLSQMQMGKSGTYWYVIFNALFKKNLIENVIVMSGNREKDLYNQVKEDKDAYTDWFFKQESVTKTLSAFEIQNMKGKVKTNVKIIWGANLSGKKNPCELVKNNTLIVWDESHYAQSEKNSPDLFFKNNGLSHLIDGTISPDEIKLRNIRLLNVSATPFSELIMNSEKNKMSTYHKVIRLIPQNTYCGIQKYMARGLIHSSIIINTDNKELIKETVTLYKNPENPKYMIVRVNNNKGALKVMKEICKELNIVCKRYNSKIVEIDLEDMNDKPMFDTMIVISGMLRMGKVVPKEHISMVYESTTKSSKRKIDTGLQGLLGRMCGYSQLKNGFDINIYVEENLIVSMSEYIVNYDCETGPKNTNCMNVFGSKKNKKKHPNTVTICRLPDADNINEFLTGNGNIQKDKVVNWLRYDFKELNEKFSESFYDNVSSICRKNLSKKTNLAFLHLVTKWNDNLTDICYGIVLPNVFYIANDGVRMYVIYNDVKDEAATDEAATDEAATDEAATDEAPDESQINSSNVRNKCVFKNCKS